MDLDIAVSIEAANVERLNAALASVEAGPGVPGALGTVFATVHGRLEIVRRADGIGDYAAWFRRARPHDIGEGITVMVADPDDVLRSKEAAGRDKDRAALPQMRRDFIEAGALAPDAARGPVAAVRAAPAAAGAPAFLAAVLGDRPPESSAARLWDGAAQLVLDYRSRWGITDPLSGLGPDALDGRQAKDRAQLDKALARARRLLRRRA